MNLSIFNSCVLLALVPLLVLSGCAQLHHIQLSDIRDTKNQSTKRIDLKLSETGVNLQEAADIAKTFMKNAKARQTTSDIENAIALFQMGPRTGNPVYSEGYAQPLPEMLAAECPGGQIQNIVSIRETRKYPVVSGEIVRIQAECVQ